MFIAQWIANATIDRFFWAGSSFGQRRFDNCTIFFLIGAAALFAQLPRWLAIAVAAIGSAWTMALFFAASAIDLNRYYDPSELFAAAIRAPAKFGFLVSVPAEFKIDVLIVFAAVAVMYLVLAMLINMRPGAIGAILCTAIAVFFALCGANDAYVIDKWSGVITKNRALEPFNGAVRDRIALLRDEEGYLRSTGKNAEADQTRSEITALEKSIPSPSP
jgi:hypothetical protein